MRPDISTKHISSASAMHWSVPRQASSLAIGRTSFPRYMAEKYKRRIKSGAILFELPRGLEVAVAILFGGAEAMMAGEMATRRSLLVGAAALLAAAAGSISGNAVAAENSPGS